MDDAEAARERLARKMRVALALHEDGVALMRQNLRRRHPTERDEEIDVRLRAWLLDHPGAERGDAEGRPAAWPRAHT